MAYQPILNPMPVRSYNQPGADIPNNAQKNVISTWQSASGLDANSVNIDPQLQGELTGFNGISDFAPTFLNNQLAGIGTNLVASASKDYFNVPFASPYVVGALNIIRQTRLQ